MPLNILKHKSYHVTRSENLERVRRDEEIAAKKIQETKKIEKASQRASQIAALRQRQGININKNQINGIPSIIPNKTNTNTKNTFIESKFISNNNENFRNGYQQNDDGNDIKPIIKDINQSESQNSRKGIIIDKTKIEERSDQNSNSNSNPNSNSNDNNKNININHHHNNYHRPYNKSQQVNYSNGSVMSNLQFNSHPALNSSKPINGKSYHDNQNSYSITKGKKQNNLRGKRRQSSLLSNSETFHNNNNNNNNNNSNSFHYNREKNKKQLDEGIKNKMDPLSAMLKGVNETVEYEEKEKQKQRKRKIQQLFENRNESESSTFKERKK